MVKHQDWNNRGEAAEIVMNEEAIFHNGDQSTQAINRITKYQEWRP
jgi:hypothetical protein